MPTVKKQSATKKPVRAERPKPSAAPTTVGTTTEAEAFAAATPAAPPATPAAVEHMAVTEAFAGQAAMVRAIRDDDLVRFRVPEDPFGEISHWERSFNGHVFRFEAGKEYEVPRFIVEEVERSRQIERISELSVYEFTHGNGKKLN